MLLHSIFRRLRSYSGYLPAAVGLAILLSAFALWKFELHRESAFQTERVFTEAKRIDLEISETLRQASLAMKRYASRVELVGVSNKKYLSLDSESYLSQIPLLRRIGVIDTQHKVTWSYPPQIAKEVANFDHSTDPRRLVALIEAKNSHAPSLSQAVELKSGGLGFLLPVALFPENKFSGFVYATVEAKKLFHGFLANPALQVRVLDGQNLLFESETKGELAPEWKQLREMSLGPFNVTLEVTPTIQFISDGRSRFPHAILLLGSLMAVLTGWALHHVIRSRKSAVESLEWRKVLINSSSYGIISTDENGIIRTFNHAAEIMLGYTSKEIIGIATPKIFHDKTEAERRAEVLTLELGRLVKPGFDAFTAKAVATGVHDENNWTFVRKDQSTFPANLSVSALFNEDGSVKGFLGVCKDLTEEKRAEAQFVLANERLTRVIEATQEGIWEREFVLGSAGGEILFMDSRAKAMFGFLADEAVDYTKVVARIFPEDMASVGEALTRHVEEKSAGFDVEMRIRPDNENAQTRWVRARGKVRLRPDKTAALVSTVRDVTDEIKARDELKAALIAAESATKAKSDFLANMSHEIRTPINGVMGMTNLLLETKLTDEQREYAQTVKSSSDALLTIINDILDISKVEAGKMEIEKIDFDIAYLISDLDRVFTHLAKSKGLQFATSAVEMPHTVFKGDSGRIRQVITNLVGNAVKFTKTGSVTVGLESIEDTQTHSKFRFSVTDTGVGIPETVRARLFQSFTQADSSVARRFGGTGLGLSISKHLVELMGGEIGLISEDKKGSTFWFTLELEKSSAVLERDAESGPSSPTSENLKFRILIAEDNIVNQRLASIQLLKLGYASDIVGSGGEAIDALRLIDYDLVLMDCQMPEMDGFEATHLIRKSKTMRFSKIPIIALTASASKDDKERCLESGMDDFLSKPFSKKQLSDMLQKWLGAKAGTVLEKNGIADVKRFVTLDAAAIASLQRMSGGSNKVVIEILQSLVHTMPQEIANLKKSVSEGDVLALHATAHKTRSGCMSAGALGLANLLEQIERSAKTAVVQDLAALVEQVEAEFHQLCDEFSREFLGAA